MAISPETSIYEYAKQGLSYGKDRTAIWFYGRSISYGELFEKIDNVADHLYALGVRQGTVVTIQLPNCPQAVMAIYAVAKLGGICNMVHALTPEAVVQEIMRTVSSSFLITSHAGIAAEQVRVVDIAAYMDEIHQNAYYLKHGHRFEGVQFEDLELNGATETEAPISKELAPCCAAYLHSGGTTGEPKTIMLSHKALNHCVDNTADFFEHGDMSSQVSLCVLPLFHGFGLVADIHRNLHFGSQIVMMTRWNAEEAVSLIKRYGVTLIVGVPAMFHALLSEAAFNKDSASSLRYCYTGGDTVSPKLANQMDERVGKSCCMLPGFGLTEATTMNCVNTWAHYKAGTAGYPVRNTTIAVLLPDGTIAARGIGELVISSPTLMMGYLNDPKATAETLFEASGKRWTRTGDEVEIDADGFLIFRDRIKNMIIHNGYNVFPDEVADAIRAVPGVRDVCVVGVEDAKLRTQSVRAVVILDQKTDEENACASIRRCCETKLPYYAVPKEIVFVNDFPRNAVGKIDRKELSRA